MSLASVINGLWWWNVCFKQTLYSHYKYQGDCRSLIPYTADRYMISIRKLRGPYQCQDTWLCSLQGGMCSHHKIPSFVLINESSAQDIGAKTTVFISEFPRHLDASG